MADQGKASSSANRITSDDRFNYIGFDVFPGKPKDLFQSESEKAQLVDVVQKKRSKGDLLREGCTLLTARVSGLERMALTIASVIILLSVFAPWYSVYNVVEDKSSQPVATAQPTGGAAAGEEVITGIQIRKKTHNEYSTSSGLGALVSIGSIGGAMFSSGFILILTALCMLAYTLLAIALPVYVLMALYKKGKESADEAALRLKKLLRLNWAPVALFGAVIFLSFMGADYASGVSGMFSSLGGSYGPAACIGSMSWGLLLTLGGFLVLASKGIEI